MLSNRNLLKTSPGKTSIQPQEDTTNPECTNSYRESSPTTHKPIARFLHPRFCRPGTSRIRLVSASETSHVPRFCRPRPSKLGCFRHQKPSYFQSFVKVSASETNHFPRFCRPRPLALGWFRHHKPSYFQGFVNPDHQN